MFTSELAKMALTIEAACPYCRENIPVNGIYHTFAKGVYAPCQAVEQRADFMKACGTQLVGATHLTGRAA